MTKTSRRKDYFTKHLFGAGIECPTKLYYYSQNYPETKQAIPFIKHAVFNKRLLKALARSVYPNGIFIEKDSVATAASKTGQLLNQTEIVIFNGIFEYRQMMARLPIVQKQKDQLTLYHIQTKTFDSRKYRLVDEEGYIYSKWRSYLVDFAYQIHLVKQICPDAQLRSFLVLPEKSGRAFTDNLPTRLEPLDDHDTPVSVAESNQELLTKLDVTDLVSKVMHDPSFAGEHLPKETFEDSVNHLRNLYLNQFKQKTDVGLKCKECEFRVEKDRIEKGVKSGFNECWEPEMETDKPSKHHVFDLIGPGTQQWIQQGKYDQRKIPLDDIFSPETILKGQGRLSQTMRQSLQIHKAQGRDVPDQIIRPELFKELERWEYPFHFLDFEAGNYAVPVRKNRSPYHLLVFQFSCHTLRQDGCWNHHQWIDNEKSGYQNYEMIRALMKISDISEGTIIQYSNFERHVLKVIRRELINEQDEISDANRLIEWIEKIIHRNDSSHNKAPYIADLSRLVKNFYYNCEMGNSLSIKDVLRSVMNHSDFLQQKYSHPYNSQNFEDMIWWQSDGRGGACNPYTLLRETGNSPISRGTEAMVVYGKMITQNSDKEERKAYREALLKYCELDTLAMVMIYQHWREEMDDRKIILPETSRK
jgi:hypothetical protein